MVPAQECCYLTLRDKEQKGKITENNRIEKEVRIQATHSPHKTQHVLYKYDTTTLRWHSVSLFSGPSQLFGATTNKNSS